MTGGGFQWRGRSGARFAALVLAIAGAVLFIAGCGGGSGSGGSGSVSSGGSGAGGSGGNAAAEGAPSSASESAEGAASSASESTNSDYIVKSDDKVTKSNGATEIVSAQFPSGRDTDEESTTGRKPVKPCSLVTAAQANKILGGHVRISERPQGPTCVFSGSGREISLVVEEVPLKPLVQGARKSSQVTAGGHHGWCLRYETSSVVFGVGRGRVLQITGPCPAGVRFAAAALPRIPA
jgi:hypothetical protein